MGICDENEGEWSLDRNFFLLVLIYYNFETYTEYELIQGALPRSHYQEKQQCLISQSQQIQDIFTLSIRAGNPALKIWVPWYPQLYSFPHAAIESKTKQDPIEAAKELSSKIKMKTSTNA